MAATYLNDAITRVQAMLRAVSATFPDRVERVYIGDAPESAYPLWNILPGTVIPARRSAGNTVQVFTVFLRLIIGTSDGGGRGTFVNSLWIVIPTVLDYFAAHPDLVLQDSQSAPNHLIVNETSIEVGTPYGPFEGSEQVGVIFTLRLAFSRPHPTTPFGV